MLKMLYVFVRNCRELVLILLHFFKFCSFQLTKEKTQKNDELLTLQEELHLTKTKLAELQVVQIELQQSRSAAYVRVNTLSEEIQRLQQIIDDLQKQQKNNDQMYALETQVSFFFYLIT